MTEENSIRTVSEFIVYHSDQFNPTILDSIWTRMSDTERRDCLRLVAKKFQ